jgi:hypothetical protein
MGRLDAFPQRAFEERGRNRLIGIAGLGGADAKQAPIVPSDGTQDRVDGVGSGPPRGSSRGDGGGGRDSSGNSTQGRFCVTDDGEVGNVGGRSSSLDGSSGIRSATHNGLINNSLGKSGRVSGVGSGGAHQL